MTEDSSDEVRGPGLRIARHYASEAEAMVVGLDRTRAMVALGPRAFPLLVADAVQLPFRDRSFDAVVTTFIARRTNLGSCQHRWASLPEESRRVLLARARQWLIEMSAEDFEEESEVIVTVARRGTGNRRPTR